MVKSDFHMHTTFCDGKSTPEEMVLSAIRLGLTTIGFSGHSFLEGEQDWTMSLDRYPVYRDEILRLKEKYASRITIYCGIEQDIWSPEPTVPLDYRIGSVHSIRPEGDSICVDNTPEEFYDGVQRCFHGDMYAAAELYYNTVSHVMDVTHADIIGHVDLIAKFNEKMHYFDQQDPFYLSCAFHAVDALMESGAPFEINTGAISRGWRTSPYPDVSIMKHIIAQGGAFILSSDSHSSATLAYEFSMAEKIIREIGGRLIDFRPGASL